MEDRLRILKQIETGELTVEEGARQLQSLAQPPEPPEPPAAPVASAARPAWMGWLWQPVFWTGVALAGGGGLLLSNAYTREAGGGLVWGWLLFALGVLGVLLGRIPDVSWLGSGLRTVLVAAITVGLIYLVTG